MKLNEFFDFCISKHKELSNDFKIAKKESRDFFDMTLSLGGKYIFLNTEEYDTSTICFDVGCGDLLMDIVYYGHEFGYGLTNYLRFAPNNKDDDEITFWVDELKRKKVRNNLEKELGMYFADDNYVIDIEAMNDNSSCQHTYQVGITGPGYETREEAIIEARKLAEKLNKKYKKCFCLKVCKGIERDEYDRIIGNRENPYIISSKSKSETIRAKRMTGLFDVNADEYVGKEPEIDKSNTLIVMAIMDHEEDGTIVTELKKYSSYLEIETAIDKRINKWLKDNKYTFNEEYKHFSSSYAEMEDDGEEISAWHYESGTELRIIRKEFKI